MKANLCKHLRKLNEAEESSKSISCIEDVWTSLIKTITNKIMLNESAKTQLDELDRILKWELRGFEESEFDWSSVNWLEIKATTEKCINNIC